MKNCPKCKHKAYYNEWFDAYFCKKCDIWLEPQCGNPECYHCQERPQKPSNLTQDCISFEKDVISQSETKTQPEAYNEVYEVKWILPIKLVSPNTKEHWATAYKRNKRYAVLIKSMFNLESLKLQPPCEVTITRLFPRCFDTDNYIASCKHIRDTIASCLIPGLAPGHADASPLIKWTYTQEKSSAKAVRISIKTLPNNDDFEYATGKTLC